MTMLAYNIRRAINVMGAKRLIEFLANVLKKNTSYGIGDQRDLSHSLI
ncbi:MAG: hypothetical protein JRN68_07630 [Nitrososphaerota archaeon]|nr:hypothetical protein [Nitrososphaerota archaeon]